MAQQPRRRLVDVGLTGWRRVVHRWVLNVEVGLATAFLLAVPFARATPAEHLLDDTLGIPVLFVAAVLIVAWWARRGGFGRGLAAGLVGSMSGLAAAVVLSVAHVFDVQDADNAAAVIAELCLPGLFFYGPVVCVTDVVLHLLERRRLEATDPVFPTARVV